MKYLILLITITQIVHAKWRPLNFDQLVRSSDAIVIAKYIIGEDTNQSKQTTSQLNQFKLLKSLKGDITKEFLVKGKKTTFCVPQVYFKDVKTDHFLLFLQKNKQGSYQPLNGNLGALKIQDQKVPWFTGTNNHSFIRKPKELDFVIQEIQQEMKN